MSTSTLAIALANLLVGATPWPAVKPNLAVYADFDPNDAFSTKLASIVTQSPFLDFDVALIDFSKPRPHLAMSARPDRTTTILSMGKLALLYAAFQLRDDVRSLVQGSSGMNRDQLVNALGQVWKKSNQARLKNVALHTDVLTRLHKSLNSIFDLSELENTNPNPQLIDFQGIEKCGMDSTFEVNQTTLSVMLNIDGFPHGANTKENWEKIQNLTFAERLWMGIAWSDNIAASSCICEIGLPYIQALMFESGLFDGQNGLYLTRNYNDPRTTQLSRTRGYFPGGNGPVQRGSARSLSALMIAIVTGNLISQQTCDDMKRLLRPVAFAKVNGLRDLYRFHNRGNVRIYDATHDPGANGTPIEQREALVKGGVNRQRLASTSHPGRFNAVAVASDWEYFEFGGTRRVGMIVVDSLIVQPITSGQSAADSELDAERKAEAQLADFVRKAQKTFPDLLQP